MNADIVFMLCPYLDLRSLFCFAAACPKWSGIIHEHVEKKKLELVVKLDRYQCWKLDGNGITVSNGSAAGYCGVFSYDARRRRDVQVGMLIELPNSVWNHVAFHVMDVSCVEINQTGWSTFSEDVYALLGKLSTAELKLVFRRRDEARRILGAIIFKPRALVKLDERSKGLDKEPILRKSQLASLKTVEYSGDMKMLSKDLLEALDYDYVIARSNGSDHQTHMLWFNAFVEEYLKANSARVRCLVREPEFEIEVQ
ncbi:unnamed protein product [Heligmosomoides polygyrus]|uniref:F-box domain-containing protein n=1 Tax=Heligmosomoides polygyrus TaxID=6339 RepID=A0A3P8B374_HELPZ|nr:unnamed protein product [Heligmosomoides polygyrus]